MTPSTSGRSHCQQTRPKPKTRIAGSHDRAPRVIRPAEPTEPGAATELIPASLALDRVQQLAHLGHELEEARILPRRHAARLRQVDRNNPGDPAGPR